jgi:uncharacterized membrane protein
MKEKKLDIRWMVSVALMSAIIVVLANTPLGMIQLPIIKATTVHIPVIIGAILLGPMAGGILGFVFGVCSLISNTMAPTLLSFAFSPFLSTTGIPGALKAIWIAVGCRVLIGVAAGWIWILLKKLHMNRKGLQVVSLAVTGFLGSMVNTIGVMGSIYLLFARQYAEAKEVAVTAVWGLIMGTVTTAGIPEAIAAAVIVAVVAKVLLKISWRE